ncbi:hypothetical protein Ciccas_007126 [Cichlidogyrus casuarinus]|uniref:Uncharacterized protein n=1 Tax=Cichlidogyrus casuarinus TaxID=1844966 RepID=A0ABD2Q3R5_9PLAT
MCESASQSISDMLRSVCQSVAGLGMMIYTSAALTLVSLAAVPPLAVMALVAGKSVRDTSRSTATQLGIMTSYSSERFANLKEVHASGQNVTESRNFYSVLRGLLEAGLTEAKSRAMFFGSAGFVGNCIILGVLFYGGELVQSQQMTIGQLGTFLMYAAYVGIASTRLSTSYAEAMRAVAASDRIWAIMPPEEYLSSSAYELTPLPVLDLETLGQLSKLPPPGETLLQLSSVDFAYPGQKNILLEEVNFDVKVGETLAIAGASGVGKSTIAALVLRLFDPVKGNIRWIGNDLSGIDLDLWRRYLVGAVLQESTLFSGTLEENILYASRNSVGKNERDPKRLEEAMKAAQLSSFLHRMDAPVGEAGRELSGGQKQRVLLARALYKQPPLLLLDEATSALDTKTEEDLFLSLRQYLQSLPHKTTVLMIAHRMSSLQHADRVLVLGKKNQGQSILAEGTLQQLTQPGDSQDSLLDSILKL